jgi:hypothetical protein
VSGYLVFFAAGPVGDALADAIRDRVRAAPGAGWFDDPAGSAAERTTGGYVRVDTPEDEAGRDLLAAARDVSAEHGVVVEVQWREQVVGHMEAGVWRPSGSA